ncbi:MAG: hypothetical protein HYX72_05220 [Acidobacteria bacterium]|nr:hypothetical protein [Acidobacteriota bacterium]
MRHGNAGRDGQAVGGSAGVAVLYTDWKNVYLRTPTAKEQLQGEEPLTQSGRMCRKLGIQIIGASSPQAKGRVERSNGTQQDLLVKKLRLCGIKTMPEANRYLRQHYLPAHFSSIILRGHF